MPCVHEFAILPTGEPGPEDGSCYERYDGRDYALWRDSGLLLPVEDDLFLPVLDQMPPVRVVWPGNCWAECLAWTGITLIPPEACGVLARCLEEESEPSLAALHELASQAREEGRWVLHFGV